MDHSEIPLVRKAHSVRALPHQSANHSPDSLRVPPSLLPFSASCRSGGRPARVRQQCGSGSGVAGKRDCAPGPLPRAGGVRSSCRWRGGWGEAAAGGCAGRAGAPASTGRSASAPNMKRDKAWMACPVRLSLKRCSLSRAIGDCSQAELRKVSNGAELLLLLLVAAAASEWRRRGGASGAGGRKRNVGAALGAHVGRFAVSAEHQFGRALMRGRLRRHRGAHALNCGERVGGGPEVALRADRAPSGRRLRSSSGSGGVVCCRRRCNSSGR